jgi:ABC-type phosphate transport system substrate-binding protein
MARSRTALGLLGLVSVWLAFASSSIASDDSFNIIVNPNNPVRSVDSDFLREAFLKKTTRWSNGTLIRPIDLVGTSPTRDRFSHDVLKKSLAQLRAYWVQRIFSGTDVPPPEADSPVNVIAFVLANPGAVGYVPSRVNPGAAKIVEIK